jgi:hypothetical protein
MVCQENDDCFGGDSFTFLLLPSEKLEIEE